MAKFGSSASGDLSVANGFIKRGGGGAHFHFTPPPKPSLRPLLRAPSAPSIPALHRASTAAEPRSDHCPEPYATISRATSALRLPHAPVVSHIRALHCALSPTACLCDPAQPPIPEQPTAGAAVPCACTAEPWSAAPLRTGFHCRRLPFSRALLYPYSTTGPQPWFVPVEVIATGPGSGSVHLREMM